jgi:hypothetical protein
MLKLPVGEICIELIGQVLFHPVPPVIPAIVTLAFKLYGGVLLQFAGSAVVAGNVTVATLPEHVMASLLPVVPVLRLMGVLELTGLIVAWIMPRDFVLSNSTGTVLGLIPGFGVVLVFPLHSMSKAELLSVPIAFTMP